MVQQEGEADRDNTAPAELIDTKGEHGPYSVIPVLANEAVNWIDAAGYVLARSKLEGLPFGGELNRQDFELHTDAKFPFVIRSYAG